MNTEFVNDIQVGGNHYESDYQHWDWAIDMNLGPIEYAASKYISRWWKKSGVQDIEKAKHYVHKIKEAYMQDRYKTGLSRSKEVKAAYQKNSLFKHNNDLTNDEAMACFILAGWEIIEDLDKCLLLLNKITKEPQKAASMHAKAV